MTVRVVTDSASDIPPLLAQELDVIVAPVQAACGEKGIPHGEGLPEHQMYTQMMRRHTVPSAIEPDPDVFANIFSRLSTEADGVVSIHSASRGQCISNAALRGKESVKERCRIEVVDSGSFSMGCGLLVMAAAREAANGAGLDQVMEAVRKSAPSIALRVFVDNLRHAVRGRHLPTPVGMLGAALRTKPVLAMQGGALGLAEVKRTRRAAKQCLCDFVSGLGLVEEAAVLYTTTPDEAESVGFHLREHFPKASIYVSRFGPWLGLHLGPGAIGVAARTREATAGRLDRATEKVADEPADLWARHWRSIA